MKIYVASSWRCARQPEVVAALRRLGHDVYDFKNPAPGDHGFGWRQCAEEADLKNPAAFRDRVLAHPAAQAGFAKDMTALRGADATVLVLPCGRSAHLELGYAVGAGQRTVVLLDDPMSEPELMYLMCTEITVSLAELLEAFREPLTEGAVMAIDARDAVQFLRNLCPKHAQVAAAVMTAAAEWNGVSVQRLTERLDALAEEAARRAV